jgi:hypothetical protein
MDDEPDVGQWLRALLKPRPRTAHEFMSRLTADTTGPPDIKRELRCLIETLLEEATTHEVIMDAGATVEGFLEERPSWRQGCRQFSPAIEMCGPLWVLTRPASRAFTSWIRAGGLIR